MHTFILSVWVRIRVYNSSQGPYSSTFCFLCRLSRSTTVYQDLVAFPSVKEYFIFTKIMLIRKIDMINSHHNFISSLTVMLCPKCQGPLYFHKTHTWFPRMLCPRFHTISDATVCFFWLEKTMILPSI